MQAEEDKENTFRRICEVIVYTKNNGEVSYTEGRSINWNKEEGAFYVFNSEERIIAIHPINEIEDVKVVRNAEPTNV